MLSLTRAKTVRLHMLDVAQGGADVVDVNEGQGQAMWGQPQKETQNVGDSDMICAGEVVAGEYVRLIDGKGHFFLCECETTVRGAWVSMGSGV